MKKLYLVATLLTVPLLLFFQNCSVTSNQGTQTSFNKTLGSTLPNGMGGSGNGEPYGGKPTYFNFEIGHTCPDVSGKLIPSPLGVIIELDNVFVLKFDGCANAEKSISKNDVSKVDSVQRPSILFQNRIFEKYDQMPDIQKLILPEKFCYEKGLIQMIQNQQSGSFIELNTFGSYENGRTTQLLTRTILNGKVDLTTPPLTTFEFKPVQKVEDSSFFKYIADLFTLTLDLSLTKDSKVDILNFTEYFGEASIFDGQQTNQVEMTCANIPVLPLIIGPPDGKNQSPSGMIPPPPGNESPIAPPGPPPPPPPL